MSRSPDSSDSRDGRLTIEPADARSAEVEGLLESYFAEIHDAFGEGTPRATPTSPEDFVPPRGQFLVVRDDDGTAKGCGGVRLLDSTTAEIKRMWLHPSLRGRGAGRALLVALEAAAVDLGASRCVLDTNATLTTAIALYKNSGWVETPRYNDNAEATDWFAKDLTPTS